MSFLPNPLLDKRSDLILESDDLGLQLGNPAHQGEICHEIQDISPPLMIGCSKLIIYYY